MARGRSSSRSGSGGRGRSGSRGRSMSYGGSSNKRSSGFRGSSMRRHSPGRHHSPGRKYNRGYGYRYYPTNYYSANWNYLPYGYTYSYYPSVTTGSCQYIDGTCQDFMTASGCYYNQGSFRANSTCFENSYYYY